MTVMWASDTARRALMPISWAPMRNKETERERKKERKTRIRSFCVEITGPFCWARQLFCLKSLLLPPDCRNRQNISQLFNLRVGKQTMMSAPRARQLFFVCFFLFYLLPVYPLLCLRLSAGGSGNTYHSAPRERQGTAVNVSSGPIVSGPLSRPL